MTRIQAASPGAKAKAKAKAKRHKTKPGAAAKISHTRRPEQLGVEDWQRALRRQFGREQAFGLQNLGSSAVFSEFLVSNPQSQRSYRVAIRGPHAGDNFCACADFASNDLGTCKHIEFTLQKLEARRGGKAALKQGAQLPFSELFLDYAGQRRLRLRLGLDCPEGLRQHAERLFEAAQGWQLQADRFAVLPAFLDAARAQGHEIRCYDDARAFMAEHRDTEARRQVLQEAYPKGEHSADLRKLLKAKLYPYQLHGALFAARVGRCLIGDEMGLGKTVQAIAAMELFARHFGVQRVLVVCPTSLKHQWQREIARFSERSATVIGGLRTVRETRYRQADFCKITNYETLARDLDLIQAWGPDLVIVDEAQRVKNWNTVAARALKRIQSPYAVVLTGTPLENRLEELVSIVQYVDPFRLGPTWRLLHQHQMRDDSGRVIGYQALDRIGQTLAPIMLRRRKAEVLSQLPERIDKTLFVQMTPEQALHHDENKDIVARIVQRWRATGYLSEKDQLRLTVSLQAMRMVCNSTYLIDHETDHGYKADELAALLDDVLEDPQAKVVVFSQWLRTHELIARRLATRGWQHVLFHGGVPGEQRGALVERFHSDPDCRVFLSTDAGGVGLNLQHAAAIVVNMDQPWNPAVLEQRIGRVHRMGQTRGVQVVNFVAKGTIEEGMLSVLAFKKSLFSGVLDGGQRDVMLQGTKLAKFMESVERVSAASGKLELEPASEPLWPVADEVGAASSPEGVDGTVTGRSLPSGAQAPEPASTFAALPSDADATPPPDPGTAGADPWGPLLQVGMKLLGELASASKGEASSRWIDIDRETGQRFLRLPVPEPETVQNLAEALTKLLGASR